MCPPVLLVSNTVGGYVQGEAHRMTNTGFACLFCTSDKLPRRPEHIIPEALGNDDLILRNEVCDECNQFFGAKIESFVLEKTPLAFWRTYLGISKKHGGSPHVDLSQPRKQKGRLPAVHPLHDNLIGFECHDDYSVSVAIGDDRIAREIVHGARTQFRFVFTPLVLSLMGRFFCKIGVELVCLEDAKRARSDAFAQARQFARFGNLKELWPIFHAQSGHLSDLKKCSTDSQALTEEVFCYQYRLLEVDREYLLLVLTVGTDTWVVCLNDPFPTPRIRSAFPDEELRLIWYSRDELQG